MDALTELLGNLTDPYWIEEHGGLYLLLFIIFAETGILIGFFLPGDPMLFIAGIIISTLYSGSGQGETALLYWILLMAISAVLGNLLGYWCGIKFGSRIMNARDTWFFKKKYVYKAKEFYEKQGGSAIILARFLPLVRTFAPIVAGIVGMNFRRFLIYNIIGGFLWTGSLVTLGYLLGGNPWVKSNLEYVIVGIVILATIPVIIKSFNKKPNE